MNQKNNGGTAFPMQDGQAIHAYAAAKMDAAPEGVDRDLFYAQARAEAISGMSLRDYFAAKAMQGAIADSCGVHTAQDPAIFAVWAYQVADAMLAERQKAGET